MVGCSKMTGRLSGRDLDDGDDNAPPPEAEAAQQVTRAARVAREAMGMYMAILVVGLVREFLLWSNAECRLPIWTVWRCHPDPNQPRVCLLRIDLEWVGKRIAPRKEPMVINNPRTIVMPFGPTDRKFIGDMRRFICRGVCAEISSRPARGWSKPHDGASSRCVDTKNNNDTVRPQINLLLINTFQVMGLP